MDSKELLPSVNLFPQPLASWAAPESFTHL